MKLLIMRSNIATKRAVNDVARLFNNSQHIYGWHVDTEDRDHVLRIEASELVKEGDIAALIAPLGYVCEDLED